ncbi:MAG: hypothetical protein OXF04_03130 [bacterium]|nr:hypothetical protein [bacterium]
MIASLWAVPSVATASGQVQGSAAFRAGYRNLTVAAKWVNPSDATQDGSESHPFTPGSRLELRIDVRGFDLPSLRFIPGGVPSLGGAARGMSTGASNGWYLKSPTWNSAYAQGMAHISIRPGGVNGGVASWSLDKAQLQLTESGSSTTYKVPALNGTFHIAPSNDPVVENISVTASVAEVELTSACRSAAPSATHQVQLALTAHNGGSTDLQAVAVEWHDAGVVPPRGGSASGVLIAEQAVIFGSLPSGTSKQGDDPAVTYCLTVAAGGQQQGHLALAHARINGYAAVNGVQHGSYRKLLGGLADEFSVTAPEPAPVPEPEGTLPGGPTQTTAGDIDENPSDAGADQAAALARVEQAAQDAVAAIQRAEQKKARADKLAKRYQKAHRAHKAASDKRDQAAEAHKAAVKKANRLAAKAVGRGERAQERADKASAAADRAAARLAEREDEVAKAKKAKGKALRQAKQALVEMRAAVAEADAATETLKSAHEALAQTGGNTG